VSDGVGGFVFNNVPFSRYSLRVEASGFTPQTRQVTVGSNLPLELSINLSVSGASEQIVVAARENLVDPDLASSASMLAANFIGRAPRINRGRQLQELIATKPGAATETPGSAGILARWLRSVGPFRKPAGKDACAPRGFPRRIQCGKECW
jgi:hypothetical protein